VKRVRYDYTAISQILTPFELEYSQVSLSDNLPISLTTLFPIQSTFYLQKNPGVVSVSLLPEAPYGTPDMLIDFFFDSKEGGMLVVL
jgi:hypothetical protein